MIQKLAVAAVVALALAAEAAFFHAVIAAPLAVACDELRVGARAGTFEESILVTPERPAFRPATGS